MNAVVQWLAGNTYAKKYSAFFGGVLVGMWIQGHCWPQIKATREAWGLEKHRVEQWMLGTAGLLLIGGSQGLSALNKRNEKKEP